MINFDFSYQKFKRFSNRYINRHFSSVQIIFIYYVLMTIVAFFLLNLPFFHKQDVSYSTFDMIFMAISTISVTGLSTFNINEVFNERGIVLLEVLFQVGSFGIMMISTFFFIISKRRISLKRRQLIMTDMNSPKLSGSIRLIKNTVFTLFIIQIIFGFVFSAHFYFSGRHLDLPSSLFHGFYQSISAVTNSGFDVTGESATPYRDDFFFLPLLMLLIMVGGIGFPVLMEVRERLSYRRKDHDLPFRFSLFSKLAISIYLFLFVGGAILIYLLERHHLFMDMSEPERWLNAMFYSTTTRNAGLQLDNLAFFQTPTLLLFSLLMFIGCSPSSVGGGVRTTTVAILGLYMLSFIKGQENITVFNRRIAQEDIKKAIVVFNLSLLMCFFSVLILTITEDHSMISLIVEVASAFGTTGLSLGITSSLSPIGKIVIAALMFIGRIGMLYTLMIFIPKEKHDRGYVYPTEKIIIG